MKEDSLFCFYQYDLNPLTENVSGPSLIFIVFLGNYGANIANSLWTFYPCINRLFLCLCVKTYIKFFTCFEDFPDYTNA